MDTGEYVSKHLCFFFYSDFIWFGVSFFMENVFRIFLCLMQLKIVSQK